MYKTALFVTGFVIFCITLEVMSQDVCPECICPVEHSPICGKQLSSGKLRGFSSMCVLNCSNRCRKNKFVFYKKGRCGSRPKNPKKPFITGRPRSVRAQRRPSLLFV